MSLELGRETFLIHLVVVVGCGEVEDQMWELSLMLLLLPATIFASEIIPLISRRNNQINGMQSPSPLDG